MARRAPTTLTESGKEEKLYQESQKVGWESRFKDPAPPPAVDARTLLVNRMTMIMPYPLPSVHSNAIHEMISSVFLHTASYSQKQRTTDKLALSKPCGIPHYA